MNIFKFIRIWYFADNQDGICADSFKELEKSMLLAVNEIESLSDMIPFYMPLSNNYVNNFAILITKTNHIYYLKDTDKTKELRSLLSSL
mgnify:CR=1 FL=1